MGPIAKMCILLDVDYVFLAGQEVCDIILIVNAFGFFFQHMQSLPSQWMVTAKRPARRACLDHHAGMYLPMPIPCPCMNECV